MSYKIVNSRHKRWEANQYDWHEQDLAVKGKREWSTYCIHQHYFESPLQYTQSGCETRYYARQFYADNPVPIAPPIQKVKSSAQGSSGDFVLKVEADYLQAILDNDVNGEGLSAYDWITSEPLQKLTTNGVVWLGLIIPPFDQNRAVTLADYQNKTVNPPKWFCLKASDVLDWVEKEGDIENGQFSRVLYKASFPVRDESTGFFKDEEAVVLYTETEIITYNETGRKVLAREENSLGFIPIVRADIGESLIGEGVQYSKKAVELSSLSMSNQRDTFFNLPMALGFKMERENLETGQIERVSLNSDTLIETDDPSHKIEFASPSPAVASETTAQIESLQKKLDASVQQAHTNYSTSASSIGSGVALKEQGSHQASSVRYIMDTLLSKFKVTVIYAQEALGLMGEIMMNKPSSYQFESEESKLDSAEILDALASSALSKESKKAINAKKLEKLFNDATLREELIKADNDAIDAEVPASDFSEDTQV